MSRVGIELRVRVRVSVGIRVRFSFNDRISPRGVSEICRLEPDE